MKDRWRWAVTVGLLSVFGAFLVLPLLTVLAEGLRPAYLLEALRQPIYIEGLRNSFALAVTVTGLVFLLAVPLAMVYDRCRFPGRQWVGSLVLLPLILPPFVGALGFQQIFSQYGALNAALAALHLIQSGAGPDWLGSSRFWVICLIEALHLYPILYLNTLTALANVDPALEDAARNLGCTGWRRFRRVTLPLIRPGLFAGGVIVFIWSFTELGTPLMLGFYRVTAVQIFAGITELETNPLSYSLVVILLVLSGACYAASRLAFGRDPGTAVTKGSGGREGLQLPGWRRWLPLLMFLAVTGAAALPHVGVVLLSVARDWYGTVLPTRLTLEHFRSALSHPYVVPSIINSLRYSLLAMVLGVGVGLTIALAAVRWRLPGAGLLDLFSTLPLAVPGIVLAFGYLSMATRYDVLRLLLDPVRNPTALLVIAYMMRRLPYVVRAAAAGLQQTPPELERAARNLGAGPGTVLRRITVPLILPNLIAGGLFAFSFSMLEVSDSLILAQKSQYFPITRAIYELAEVLGAGPYIACAFGVWAMAFLATAIVVANRLLGERMGTMFRL